MYRFLLILAVASEVSAPSGGSLSSSSNSNCLWKPLLSFSSTLLSSLSVTWAFMRGNEVSPHVMYSDRASWMYMYWAYRVVTNSMWDTIVCTSGYSQYSGPWESSSSSVELQNHRPWDLLRFPSSVAWCPVRWMFLSCPHQHCSAPLMVDPQEDAACGLAWWRRWDTALKQVLHDLAIEWSDSGIHDVVYSLPLRSGMQSLWANG